MRNSASLKVLWLVATLGAVTGCPDDTTAAPDAAVAPQTALQTPYNKQSSTLGAVNVQDAIDELAQRPIAEAAIGSRLELVVREFPNNNMTYQQELLYCPDKDHDIAMSGSCNSLARTAALRSTILGPASFYCEWSQLEGNTGNYDVRVLCLRNAR